MEDSNNCERCGANPDDNTMDSQIRQMLCGMLVATEEALAAYKEAMSGEALMVHNLHDLIGFLTLVGNGSNLNAMKIHQWMIDCDPRQKAGLN